MNLNSSRPGSGGESLDPLKVTSVSSGSPMERASCSRRGSSGLEMTFQTPVLLTNGPLTSFISSVKSLLAANSTEAKERHAWSGYGEAYGAFVSSKEFAAIFPRDFEVDAQRPMS